MEQNIGEMERLLRVILGIYAMLLGFLFVQGVVGIILGVVGGIALLTGLTGWCGIYTLLKREPVKAEEDRQGAA
jgi:hypothetical protein